MIAVMLIITIVMGFIYCQPSSVNPLTEDLNMNSVPDLIEVQKGSYEPIKSYICINTLITLPTITVAVIPILPTFPFTSEIEMRNRIDLVVKIFKSKYRRWWV